jgi:SAM-dependent methyltransferase
MKNFYKKKSKFYDRKLNIHIFSTESKPTKDYSSKDTPEIHDNSLIWLSRTINIKEKKFRQEIMSKLKIKKNYNILIVGAGAGNDIPYLLKKINNKGNIFAQDISKPMIYEAARRYNVSTGKAKKINFSISDACYLPFKDEIFDITYHFGGVNLFSNVKRGISEMCRVTKIKGTIMFGDEGVGEWLKSTIVSKALINNNKLYNFKPPIEYLPLNSQNVSVEWILNNTFYLVKFNKGNDNWSIDLNVKHKGYRGGSIKTRFFGKLEGINPSLRNKFYKKLKKLNINRVSALEEIIKDYIRKK